MNDRAISIFPGNLKSYLQNSVFDTKKMDEWNPIFIKLKKFLKQKNIDINTYDIPTKMPFRDIYFDLPYIWDLSNFPVWKIIFFQKEKSILLVSRVIAITTAPLTFALA